MHPLTAKPVSPLILAAAPDMLRALLRLTHPNAGDEDVRFALDVIERATGLPAPWTPL